MKLTYHEAYNKIIDAYFKDEIEPYCRSFCFCGTLAPTGSAYVGNNWDYSKYSMNEFHMLEIALLSTIDRLTINCGDPYVSGFKHDRSKVFAHPDYEDALFSGMCAALEVLKEIHKARGENVDEVPEFKKRLKLSSLA